MRLACRGPGHVGVRGAEVAHASALVPGRALRPALALLVIVLGVRVWLTVLGVLG